MIGIQRRRRRVGTILAQCSDIIRIDNLIPLTVPPICLKESTIDDEENVLDGDRDSSQYILSGLRDMVDFHLVTI